MDNYEIKKAELKIQVLSSVAGAKGEEGESMYEIAKKNGFEGTEQEFIAQYMNVNARIGCYECDTDSSTSAKTVQGGKFILPTIPPYGGTIKVKFKYKNSAANPTLSISGCTAKPLYYDGAIASSTNTWADNETVDIYYDGTNFYANNVEGGGKFASGEKVKNVGIDSEPTAGSNNLLKSSGVFNEVKKYGAVPQYFSQITSSVNLNSRIKEIYLEGVDTTKKYDVWYCRYYQSYSYYQLIIRAYTQPDKSDAIRAFYYNLSNIDGVVKLINYEGFVGNAWVILTMTTNDTTNATGEIDLNVACNLNYSPGIKESFDKGYVGDGMVTTTKIVDEAVIPEKTSFFEKSYNLFDKNKVVPGYLNIRGEVVDSSSNLVTSADYILIKPSTLYYFVPSDHILADKGRCVCFYDSNKAYISNSLLINVESATSPANAAYMRITYQDSTQANYGQITEGEKKVYTEYSSTIKQDYIPIINNPKIADGAVTPEKTVFFDTSPNLFNPNDLDVEQGYLNLNGTISTSANIRTSGWIQITPSTLYHFESSNKPLSESKARCVCFYNIDKEYISGSLLIAVESATSSNNAYWMRVSYINNNDDWDNGQITPLQKYPYSKFGIALKEKYIPDITPEPVVESVPEVVFPSKIYALKGYENSVYFKNIADYVDPLYLFDGNGGIWDYYARYLRTKANTAGVISFRQKRVRDLSVIKTITLTTNIGNPATDNGNKNINCIGDSFTYGGKWFDWINTCCPNLTFVGMRKSVNTSPTLRAEGRGGWRLASYFKPYGDLTPTHMQPFSPFMHVVGYTYYGPIEFWKAIVTGTSQYTYGTNGFDDYISWFDNNGYKVNPSANDLMYDGTNDKYVYWNGSDWVDFTDTPTFVFDYSKYINTWNIASPDFVMIMLGVNDWFGGYSDDAAIIWNEQMNTVIQSIQSYATSVNKTIIIGICTNTTIIGMPNNNYKHNVELYSRGIFLGRKNTIQTFDNDTYRNQGVYVVDTGACLDPDYGFSVNEIKPFDYYEDATRELYGSNGVHPSEAGYKQLGTCAAGFIQYIRGL